MSYEDRLAVMDDAYKSTPAAGSYELPPDGEYQAVVDRFDFIESKKNDRLYLKTEMSVTSGEHAGWPVSTLHDLEDRDRLKYVKAHLQILGVEFDALSELESAVVQALDVPVLISVKTNGEYRNVYVNQRLGAPLTSDLPADPIEPDSDDPVPF